MYHFIGRQEEYATRSIDLNHLKSLKGMCTVAKRIFLHYDRMMKSSKLKELDTEMRLSIFLIQVCYCFSCYKQNTPNEKWLKGSIQQTTLILGNSQYRWGNGQRFTELWP